MLMTRYIITMGSLIEARLCNNTNAIFSFLVQSSFLSFEENVLYAAIYYILYCSKVQYIFILNLCF